MPSFQKHPSSFSLSIFESSTFVAETAGRCGCAISRAKVKVHLASELIVVPLHVCPELTATWKISQCFPFTSGYKYHKTQNGLIRAKTFKNTLGHLKTLPPEPISSHSQHQAMATCVHTGCKTCINTNLLALVSTNLRRLSRKNQTKPVERGLTPPSPSLPLQCLPPLKHEDLNAHSIKPWWSLRQRHGVTIKGWQWSGPNLCKSDFEFICQDLLLPTHLLYPTVRNIIIEYLCDMSHCEQTRRNITSSKHVLLDKRLHHRSVWNYDIQIYM